MKLMALAFIVVLCFMGCKGESFPPLTFEESAKRQATQVKTFEAEDKAGIGTTSTADESAPSGAVTPENVENKVKLIKTAQIRCQVKDYKSSRAAIGKMVERYGAYIASENETNTGYSVENNISIRVRCAQFDELVEQLLSEASYLNYRNINLQDITEEFVDIEARLDTKREVEKRYFGILKQAKTIEDILAVEGELRVIREEIEATAGRLRYISDRVDFSTINLAIYQTVEGKPAPGMGFFGKIARALRGGWRGILGFIIALAYIWPIILVIAAIIVLIKIARRRGKGRQQ